MRRAFLIAGALTLALGGWATAQDDRLPPPGGPDRPARRAPQRLSAEKAEAAWTLQAMGVAASLDLTAEQSTQLVEAYVGNRKALGEAGRAAAAEREPGERPGRGRGAGGARGGGANAAARELAEQHRGELEETLSVFLTDDQTAAAMTPLGTFNRNWDRMVDVVAGFELDDATTIKALAPIQGYVVSLADIRRSGDRQTMRESMMEAREKLAVDLGAVLSEEQVAAVQAVGNRGRRGRGGMGARLMEFDANGDGKLQEDEVPEEMLRMFDRLDANGDGVIDEAEIAAMAERGGRGGRGGLPDEL